MCSYSNGCRCVTCSRAHYLAARAWYEQACIDCGQPCWGTRCRECYLQAARTHYTVQPRGLHYQWGCP